MSILAEVAEWPEDIDVERAKKAEERARKRLELRVQILILQGQSWHLRER